jgi:hypothetical protein
MNSKILQSHSSTMLDLRLSQCYEDCYLLDVTSYSLVKVYCHFKGTVSNLSQTSNAQAVSGALPAVYCSLVSRIPSFKMSLNIYQSRQYQFPGNSILHSSNNFYRATSMTCHFLPTDNDYHANAQR